jgi:hypothetical protein
MSHTFLLRFHHVVRPHRALALCKFLRIATRASRGHCPLDRAFRPDIDVNKYLQTNAKDY